MEQVTLHGMWASPFSQRVKLALKLKGIPYNYVEEDLINKSQELLQYNPIHKKIPVLVHNGKPIVESLIILEYIEDAWKDTPPLMPRDPFLRSKVRFWYQYFEQTLSPSLRDAVLAEGEEAEKAAKVLSEKLEVLEEGLREDFGGGAPFAHGEQLGFLDVAVGVMACYMPAFEEAGQVKLIDPEKNSTFFKWMCALKDHPVVKEVMPAHERLVAHMKQAWARLSSAYKAEVRSFSPKA